MMSPSLNKELDLLGWRLADGTLTLRAYQEALVVILQRLFNCSTVALWRVTGVQGEQALDALGRYQVTGAGLRCGEFFPEVRLGKSCAPLSDRGFYICDDTLSDRNLSTLGGRDGRPDTQRTFLEARVAINGQALGVLICCRDAGQSRWAIDEETTLRRLAGRVALHLTRLHIPRFDPGLTDDARDWPK